VHCVAFGLLDQCSSRDLGVVLTKKMTACRSASQRCQRRFVSIVVIGSSSNALTQEPLHLQRKNARSLGK